MTHYPLGYPQPAFLRRALLVEKYSSLLAVGVGLSLGTGALVWNRHHHDRRKRRRSVDVGKRLATLAHSIPTPGTVRSSLNDAALRVFQTDGAG